jgi:hypothetical protein
MILKEDVIVAELKQAKVERDEERKRKFRLGRRDSEQK